jgi:Peptidase MA superfamily/WD40-like Beta Propeller Repeat
MMRRATVLLIGAFVALPGAAAAQINYFGQNKIQYRDFAWQVLRGPHVDLYYYPQEDDLARLALAYAEESFPILVEKFGHRPTRRIPLLIYASHTDFEQTNVLPFVPPEGILGVTDVRSRILVPFQGDYTEFRHTIRHELVHAFQLSVEMEGYERYFRSPPPIPLWWSEGLAEYWSGGEDTRDEMILRELTISGTLPTLQELSFVYSAVVYAIGGALHRWLAAEFGEWRVQVLYRDLWKYDSFEDALAGVYGLRLDELNDRYQLYFRRRYFPVVSERTPLGLTTRQLADLAIKPVAYRMPGDSTTRLLYLSPRSGYMTIHSMRLDRPRSGRAEVTGERSAEFESFHPFASRMDVRDGVAIFSSKYQDRDALFFWDLHRERVVGRYQFPNLVSVLSPAWAPDGKSIVFSGLTVGGISDLYRVWLPDGKLEHLTQDRYNDLDPTFSPDGRTIVFSSDRTPFGLHGALNLFRLDVATGGIDYLTYGSWRDETPRWATNDRIYFTSDRSGIFDIYSVDVDGNGRQETRTLSGAFDPEWIEADSALVYGGFDKLSFGIFRSRSALPPDSAATFALASHRQEPDWTWAELSDASVAQANPTSYEQRYSLDFATGDAAVAPGYGAAAGLLFLFSDFLTDHLVFVSLTSFQESGISDIFSNINGSIVYLNQKRRLNWGAGAFRLRGTFYEGDFETVYDETSWGGFVGVRWPYSRYSRVESQFRIEHSDRFDLVGGDREEPRRVGWLASNYVSFVRDNSLWLPTGPIDGERRNLTFGVTNDLTNGRFDAWMASLDERRYFRLASQSAFAVRFFGYYANGARPRQVALGGSWGLRGYPPLSNVGGTRAVMLNAEVRFPVLSYLGLGLPIGPLRFPGVQGAIFNDLGGGWTDDTKDRGLLGSAGFGLRMALFYPLVLRLDFGWRYNTGDIGLYSLPELTGQRRFLQFFFGFNY